MDNVFGISQGMIELVRHRAKNKIPFDKGISVGGGVGHKEMHLLNQGIVNQFELYEYSEDRIVQGRELAEKKSLQHRIDFIHGDAFEIVPHVEKYDFVHWNNSLHHMLDVDQAIEWSKNILKPGGLFFMDDYIGSSKFQWPDAQLEFATRVRKVFENSKYLRDPHNRLNFLPTKITRPNVDDLIRLDPSEAADSEKIVEAIYKHFPKAELKATGGVIYHLVLNDMLNNFDEKADMILFSLIFCVHSGQLLKTSYGVQKPKHFPGRLLSLSTALNTCYIVISTSVTLMVTI